jgi:hypothetical protein
MAGFISTPHWEEKPDTQPNRWRYYDISEKFKEQFGNIHPDTVFSQIDINTSIRRGGKVGDFSLFLKDLNGIEHEFYAESFFNTYYVLTLLVHVRQLKHGHIIIPKGNTVN